MRFALLPDSGWQAAADIYHTRLAAGDSKTVAFRRAHEGLCKRARLLSQKARAVEVPEEAKAIVTELVAALAPGISSSVADALRARSGSPRVGLIRDEIAYALDAMMFDHRVIGSAFNRDRSTVSISVTRHGRRIKEEFEVRQRMESWLGARGRTLSS